MNNKWKNIDEYKELSFKIGNLVKEMQGVYLNLTPLERKIVNTWKFKANYGDKSYIKLVVK